MSLNKRDSDGLQATWYVYHRVHVDFEDHAAIFDGQINAAEGQTQRPRRRDGQLGEFGREVVNGNGGGHRTQGLVAGRLGIGLHMLAHPEYPVVEDDHAELVTTSVVIDVPGVAGRKPVLP